MTFDLLVIGGGINGACIARDAAGRGLNVLLVERDDLASHTSSASTKLIHGGLRYLELFEFALVRKALAEREIMLRAAPHIMRPLRFVMPHDDAMRPLWLIRAGLFLYDHLARRDLLPASRIIDLAAHPAGAPLQAQFRRGFEYSDGWTDDARLVVLNCLDAAERGATVLTRTECVRATRGEETWQVELQRAEREPCTVEARAVVNATGPWVADCLTRTLGVRAHHRVRLVKGSHIVVPRLFEHDHAYLFQAEDRRVIFALPYEQDFTLIGTTELEYHEDPRQLSAVPAEIAYLCAQANRYFRRAIGPEDVRWHFAGVRPLLDDTHADPSAVTRDYLLELDSKGPPLLSVFGGKITTCRKLAEEALATLQPLLGNDAPSWTARAPLPGGDLPRGDFGVFRECLLNALPAFPPPLLARLGRAYGSRCRQLVGSARTLEEFGEEVLPGLHAAEIDYLRQYEWARTAEDILWRRSKLGLHLGPDAEPRLDAWLREHPFAEPPCRR